MKKVVLILLLPILFMNFLLAQGTAVNVASFNLRMDTPNDGENAWPNRKEMVKELIRFHNFEIFGVQEAFKHMLDDVTELKGYAYIGVGRDDGIDAGEHSAIIYKTDRFEVLDKGNFWFSEAPDVPGKGWDATCCNRICSWGKFRDKLSGKTFFFFNVHYDHEGKEARRESSKLLISRIKKIVGSSSFFCTGDFNATPESEPIQIIYNDGLLNDSYKKTKQPPYGPVGTFQGFKIQTRDQGRIDYIFVSKDIVVNKYGVLTDMNYNRFPSDHFPVVINAEM